jgi:hypothetical protein
MLAKRFVRQRRGKSMKRLAYFVNPFFSSLTLHLHASFCGEANYSKALAAAQELFAPSRLRAVQSPFLADCRNRVAYIGGDLYSCIITKFVTLVSYSRVKALHVSYT